MKHLIASLAILAACLVAVGCRYAGPHIVIRDSPHSRVDLRDVDTEAGQGKVVTTDAKLSGVPGL